MRRRKGNGSYRKRLGLVGWRRTPRARSRRGSRHLLDRWRQVAERLRAARHLALFLDFDGTLASLRRRPEQVWLEDAPRRLLRRLARHPQVTLCLVSGRRLADLRKRAKVYGAHYLGLHGWERDGAVRPKDLRKPLAGATRLVREYLSDLPDIWVEDKGLSFAVHYRGAKADAVRRAQAALRQALKRLGDGFRLLKGKKVWEVLPRAIEGKGAAVRALLAKLPGGALPIYVGDDVTDESAFAALPRGLTVRVGQVRRTRARFTLRNPREVANFLQRLESELT